MSAWNPRTTSRPSNDHSLAVAERPVALPLLQGTSLGEVVPVRDGPISAAVHERACELATTAARDADKLKWTVGPAAKARGFDAWLLEDEPGPAVVKVGSAIVGAIACLAGSCLYGLDGVVAGAHIAAGGAATLAFAAWTGSVKWRVERALTKARSQRVESAQIDKLLRPFQGATPETRAIAAKAMREELAAINTTLSAKAVELRDSVLVVQGALPDIQRAARLAEALATLLRKDAGYHRSSHAITTISACLAEATPAERREMATAIERCAFDGEQPRFAVNDALDLERRLYSAMRAAENGEAPAVDGSRAIAG